MTGNVRLVEGNTTPSRLFHCSVPLVQNEIYLLEVFNQKNSLDRQLQIAFGIIRESETGTGISLDLDIVNTTFSKQEHPGTVKQVKLVTHLTNSGGERGKQRYKGHYSVT